MRRVVEFSGDITIESPYRGKTFELVYRTNAEGQVISVTHEGEEIPACDSEDSGAREFAIAAYHLGSTKPVEEEHIPV